MEDFSLKEYLKNNKLLQEAVEENVHGTPAFEKRVNKYSEHPKWYDMTAGEIQTYIDENPNTLWGRDLGIAKMVRDKKLKQEELEGGDLNEEGEDLDNVRRALEQDDDSEEEEFEGVNPVWVDENGDGWNEEWADSVGLMEFFQSTEELAYEIRNARIGSYALRGINNEEAGEALLEYIHGLKMFLDDIESNINAAL